jgi:hypothetical protein
LIIFKANKAICLPTILKESQKLKRQFYNCYVFVKRVLAAASVKRGSKKQKAFTAM